MTELIEYRNRLMRELDAGFFDIESWEVCAKWAEIIDCLCIKSQVERYIDFYSEQDFY